MFVFGFLLVVIGILAFVFANKTQQQLVMKACGGVVVLFGVIIAICTMSYVVNPGVVGFEVLFGNVEHEAQAGFHWKNPFSSIVTFDVKTMKYEIEADGASKDLQNVKFNLAVNYRLDYTKVGKLYTEVGHDYGEKILAPAVQEIVKSCASKFNVEEIITKRIDLKNMIDDMMSSRLSNFYIVLQGVNIMDIQFDPKFNEVVEAKQIEQQKIQTAEYMRLQAEKNKMTTILNAQAESEKQRLLRETTSPEVIQLKWIEAWKEGGSKVPQIISGKGGSMFMLNVTPNAEEK